MSFLSDLASSKEYVTGVTRILNDSLWAGWSENTDKKGVDIVHPMFVGGCEVKADFKAHNTGNLFFEWECSCSPSGVRKYEGNVLWAQIVADTGEFILFDTRMLIQWLPENSRWLANVGDGNASGWLCKMEDVKKICLLNIKD